MVINYIKEVNNINMVKANDRIEREKQFHDLRYADDNERQKKVSKFYKITKSITSQYHQTLLDHCQGAKIIEYGCGKGSYAFELAKNQAKLVTGIDISPVAIDIAVSKARDAVLKDNLNFVEMNAEQLEFAPDSYDLICGSGILHHLDLERSLSSINKVLKSQGKAVFLEPLGHNFLINLYRQLTPSIRSEDEHPLLDKDLEFIAKQFKQAKIKYFYLTSLAASIIAGKPGFNYLLGLLEVLDSILFKLPFLKKQAWLVLIELSEPKKY